MQTPALAEVRSGDFIKATVAGERLWFKVLNVIAFNDRPIGFVCRLDSKPDDPSIVFDGRVTIDVYAVIETGRAIDRPKLAVVK